MYLSLSDRSQQVMGLARDEALRLRHEYLGTEHILLGIVSESSGANAGALAAFQHHPRSGPVRRRGHDRGSARPPHHPMTAGCLQAAAGHRIGPRRAAHRNSPQVEPEHLLLGVTRVDHGVATQVLRDLLAPPKSVRAKVSELIDRGNVGTPNDG